MSNQCTVDRRRGLGDGGHRLLEWTGGLRFDQLTGKDGVAAADSLVKARLLDEIQVHLVPVPLGQGRRLFEDLGPEQVELETVEVLRGAEETHLRYRVVPG